MSVSARVAAASVFALLALQWLWRWAVPSDRMPVWVAATLFSLPLLPAAAAFLLGRPRAGLWAGIVALFYFCHGIAELRATGDRWALAEIALSLLVVIAGSWPGLRAKLAKRGTAPTPPNV